MKRRFFRDAQGEPRLWWHWRNLDTEHHGGREVARGRGWRHGRAWLHLVPDWRRGQETALGVEWVFGKLGLGVSVEVGDVHDGDGVAASLSLPGARLYLNADGGPFAWVARRLMRGQYGSREVSLRCHDGAIWWVIWRDDAEWSRPTGILDRIRRGAWHPLDTFLGSVDYCTWDLEEREVEVPMPERAYRGTAVLSEAEWRRPRWPWPRRRRMVHIRMAEGEQVPHPGKGENSWDGDEDATYSISTGAGSIEEGIGHLVASVLRNRRRHGGARWRPEAVRG